MWYDTGESKEERCCTTTMSNLENIVKENAKEYYTTGKQKLSDDVFDAVIDKIKEENPNSNVLSTAWGYKPDSDNKIKHKYCHIGSLGKAKTIKDLQNSVGKHELYVSAKLDGMSVVLYYENGVLVKALTRGDGEYGIDITNKITKIKGCITELKSNTFTGAVRGEIMMTPKDFKLYKEKYPEAKNHRNSAVGIIGSDDAVEDYKYLTLNVYTLVSDENETVQCFNIIILYQWLSYNFGNYVVPYEFISYITEEDFYGKFLKLKEEFETKVNIDGLVITNDIIHYNNNTSCFEYKQIAFKFQDEIKITTVKCVEWTQSKHSAYIPVVVIEPIELEGTTVKRVTGYNAKYIMDMNIKEGSTVAVCKCNQIIPKIVEVLD